MKSIHLDKKYLLSRIKKVAGCWEWQLSTNNCWYWKIKHNGKNIYVHRLSYMLYKWELWNMLVCHHCDNPKCINPNHLFLWTVKDNAQDMIKKGRHKFCIASLKGNNFRGKSVKIWDQIFKSFREAGKAFGISDNWIRKRIKLGWYW